MNSPSQALTPIIANALADALGQFGHSHIDENDSGAALTSFTLIPSFPDDYESGYFAYHDYMVYIAPTEISLLFFTGLHFHGGTAPSPPPGIPPIPSAYRLGIVCYPNGKIMQGESRNALVPFCGSGDKGEKNHHHKDVLKIPPELRNRERCVLCHLCWLPNTELKYL